VCKTGKERAELGSRTPRASNVGHERIFSIALLLQRVVGTRYAMSGIPQKSSRTKQLQCLVCLPLGRCLLLPLDKKYEIPMLF
jgi:hypothetical protein